MAQPQPLSPNNYPPGSDNSTAYERCLALEQIVEPVQGSGAERKFTPQLCGRILGYMMLEAPTEAGRSNIQREISSCADNTALKALARLYAMFLLTLFKKAPGPTPTTSSHPSRGSFDDSRDIIAVQLAEAAKSNKKVKELALERDGYRCIVTGAYDWKTFFERRKIDPSLPRPGPLARTEAAHIFPDSLNQDLAWNSNGEPGKKLDYSATAWAVVERFGQINVISDLQGSGIHRIENVMTMNGNVHDLFDTLQLWFEATDALNTYRTCSTEQDTLIGFAPSIPATITFTSTDPVNLPVPHPAYLRMHAACARVAHFSGAAEYVEEILEEWEERPVMASDGTSADMLDFMLLRFAIAAH